MGAGGGADELLDEEGVALGALDDHVDLVVGEHGRRTRRRQAGDQLADLGGVERLEGHPVHALEARPLGDLGAQRVLAVQVVGAVGRDERHRLAERAGEQEAHQVTGRLVGPVEVLDHEDERLLLGGGLEEGVHGIEQRGPVEWGPMLAPPEPLAGLVDHPAAGREAVQGGVVAGDGGEHLGGRDLEAAEDLGEGEVGQGAVGEVEAVAGDDLPAEVEGAVAQRGEEAGLADAGVAGEEDDAAAGRAVSPDATMPSRRVRSSSSASRPTRGAVVTGAMQPIMSVGGDSGASGFGGRADHRVSRSSWRCRGGVRDSSSPALAATGATGADGAPVLADPVHAVLELCVDQQVVHVSFPSSVPGRFPV